MSSTKERIDILLVEQGFYDSREKAKAAIMAGLVFANDEPIDKPGMKLLRTANLRVKGATHPYVSRGGLKLEKALHDFKIDIQHQVMIDIGASTGGFTDCALRHGVEFVYAIDVGHNQLDWSIRNHPRVKVMEKTNFRYMKPQDLQGRPPTFATIDVSFISLSLILPPLQAILAYTSEVIAHTSPVLAHPSQVVALIKPQFEAGRDKVGKSGVIRDAHIHREVLETILLMAHQLHYHLQGLTFSPITGGEGNIEFLAYWQFGAIEIHHPSSHIDPREFKNMIDHVVKEANAYHHEKVSHEK